MCKTHYVQICNKYILPLKTDTFSFDFHFSIFLKKVYLLSHFLLLEVFFPLFFLLALQGFSCLLSLFWYVNFCIPEFWVFLFCSKCFLTTLWVNNWFLYFSVVFVLRIHVLSSRIIKFLDTQAFLCVFFLILFFKTKVWWFFGCCIFFNFFFTPSFSGHLIWKTNSLGQSLLLCQMSWARHVFI